MTLRLVIGLPNSGKTTYSKQYRNVIHMDDLLGRSVEEHQQKYRSAMDDVCIEGVYNDRTARKIVLDAVKADRKICVWLDTPLEECLRRETRGRQKMLIHNHARRLEPPALEEGWDEIIVIRQEKRR